jgi:hypothetical protein
MDTNEAKRLQDYCITLNQLEIFTLLEEGKTKNEILEIMPNMNSESAVGNVIRRVRGYATSKGFNADANLDAAVEGMSLRGMSDFQNMETGELSRRWLKYDVDKQAQVQAFIEYLDEKIANGIASLDLPPLSDTVAQEEGLTVYPVADAHVGLYTSEEETGEHTNLEIQIKNYKEIIHKIVSKADATDTCIIALLGDFFHANDATNATPAHKHILDVSARFHEVIEEGENLVRYFVETALQKHQTVHIRIEEGNHDPDATKWFRALVRSMYRDNDRVVTHDSDENFYGIKYGNTLHITHHGHRIKQNNVMSSIINKFRAVLNEIDFIYIHSGHWHNNNVTTQGIVRMETHATFAPNDDYAEGGGWHAVKFATAITYAKNGGGAIGSATASIIRRKEAIDIPNI